MLLGMTAAGGGGGGGGGDEGKGNKVTSVAVDIITRADHVTGIIRARFVDSPPATIASLKKCL